MNDPDDGTRTLRTPGRFSAAPGRALSLTVVSGPDRGLAATIAQPRVVVGRAESADFHLTDPTVSQFHAELAIDDWGIALTDLGSRNGTSVAGVRTRDATVPSGSDVSLGSTILRVDLGEPFVPEQSASSSFGALVGGAPAMRAVFALLERLAQTELSVLLEGETGTGKELAARALHEVGGRRDGPFVVLDCTAIPAGLAESVLFGHEKGAFTGALERRPGVFEAATGGTLLLDEIGELAPDLQPKLLRVLERREVVPVGATRPRPIQVRFLSSTWRDLRARVNCGAFREDLYHRLAQVRVRLPSLDERPEDLRPLVQFFLGALPPGVTAARAITPDALEAIAARAFPGNVRELKNTVERLALLAEGPSITSTDLAFERILAAERARPAAWAPGAAAPAAEEPDGIEPFKEAKRTLIDEFERQYLGRLLARAGTNVSRAAALAGIERQSLRDLLRKHGLRGAD